jgi:hypothetical protein
MRNTVILAILERKPFPSLHQPYVFTAIDQTGGPEWFACDHLVACAGTANPTPNASSRCVNAAPGRAALPPFSRREACGTLASLGGVKDPKLHAPPFVTAKHAFEVEHRERTTIDDQNRTVSRSIPVDVTAKNVVA